MIDSVHASGLSQTEKENLFANIELGKMAIQDYIDFLKDRPLYSEH